MYKDGWNAEGTPKWATQPLFTPIYQTIVKAKEAFCAKLVINTTPCLENCRPRLFAAVSDLITALSSEALPFLKKKFLAGSSNDDSLNMDEFTECLFLQLYESHPKIIEELEAPFAVAMIQEMFLQIDYNGDGHSTWNEFTTFLSITGQYSTCQFCQLYLQSSFTTDLCLLTYSTYCFRSSQAFVRSQSTLTRSTTAPVYPSAWKKSSISIRSNTPRTSPNATDSSTPKGNCGRSNTYRSCNG